MAEEKLTVLKVAPGMVPETVTVEDSLESLQNEVGGYIETTYPFSESVCIICNEEGKIRGLPLNRALMDKNGEVLDIIAGTFLIVGVRSDSFCSLSAGQIRTYSEMFARPQMFFRQNGKIEVISKEAVPRKGSERKELKQLQETMR